MQPLSPSTPITLTVAAQDIYTSSQGKVASVALILSNIDAAAHVVSIDIGKSGDPLEVSLAAHELRELPAMLVANGAVLDALADAGDVVRLVGKVEIVG
jgi:hypothetical protein